MKHEYKTKQAKIYLIELERWETTDALFASQIALIIPINLHRYGEATCFGENYIQFKEECKKIGPAPKLPKSIDNNEKRWKGWQIPTWKIPKKQWHSLDFNRY